MDGVMKASELRIGNLIYWDVPEKANTSHEVVGIVKGKPQTVPISLGDSIEDYKPIPLTEEWLVRLGFVIDEQGWKTLYICNNYTYLDWKEEHGMEICLVDLGTKISHIKYVHQLQNLYFALTGEELEMKKQ